MEDLEFLLAVGRTHKDGELIEEAMSTRGLGDKKG